jgi:hypothetical protein
MQKSELFTTTKLKSTIEGWSAAVCAVAKNLVTCWLANQRQSAEALVFHVLVF